MTSIVQRLAALHPPTPTHLLLANARRVALDETLGHFETRARALSPGLEEGVASARDGLAALAEEALVRFREAVAREVHTRPVLRRVEALDRYWRETNATEIMDDPHLPEDQRTEIIEALDAFNTKLGSYGLFLDALRPLLRRTGTTQVLDLASGHGGFPLALAQLAQKEGLSLDVTATDLKPEYLEVGRARAHALGLRMRFRQQDALDLRNLLNDPPDVVVCTQAIHHFPAGLVARMFDEATRVATRGVVIIDGVRNMLHAGAISLYGYGIARVSGFAHDGLVSLRRFYALEELDLLANLVPKTPRAEAVWIRPSHAAVRYVRGASSPSAQKL